MMKIWIILFPILIADIMNPVLFTFLVYAAGTKYPVKNSGAVLIGHTLAYFCVGFILALGLEQVTDNLGEPQFIDYIISVLIGIFLLWIALRPPKKKEKKQSKPDEGLTPIKAFGLGAVVNFLGIPFALPYFAALSQILKAGLTTIDSVITLLVYNLLYALAFVIVPLLAATAGERSQILLKRINQAVERISACIMSPLLVITGFALIIDSVKFFLTGKGLF